MKPDGTAVDLPANSATVSVLATAKELGVDVLRGGPLAIDGEGRPHVMYRSLSNWPSDILLGTLADDGEWRTRPLTVSSSDLQATSIAHSGSITFTSAGDMRAALTYLRLDIEDPITFWGHPSHGVAWLADGELKCAEKRVEDVPSWLPSIERPTGHNRVDRPAWIHTVGVRGDGLSDVLTNRVVFERQ